MSQSSNIWERSEIQHTVKGNYSPEKLKTPHKSGKILN
jgi:hypothetical protein